MGINLKETDVTLEFINKIRPRYYAEQLNTVPTCRYCGDKDQKKPKYLALIQLIMDSVHWTAGYMLISASNGGHSPTEIQLMAVRKLF